KNDFSSNRRALRGRTCSIIGRKTAATRLRTISPVIYSPLPCGNIGCYPLGQKAWEMSNHSEQTDRRALLKHALAALEKQQAKLDAVEKAQNEPIAIIGMSCRFPGGAHDPEAFWRLLCDGRDAIREVPAERWDVHAYANPVEASGRMATWYGGFLEQIDHFDPQFFGITPREAAGMDPQQRLVLEVSWEALERAGQAPDTLAGSQT